MELEGYVNQVQQQLAAAAALGDDRVREIASALASAAEPAVRLAILGALAGAADEITAALLDSPGSPAVAVHLDGDEVRVAVTSGGGEPAPPVTATRTDEGDASARISLRLSEALKTEIDGRITKSADWVKSNIQPGDKGNQGGVGGGKADEGMNHSGSGDGKGMQRKKGDGTGGGAGTGGGGGKGTGGGAGSSAK